MRGTADSRKLGMIQRCLDDVRRLNALLVEYIDEYREKTIVGDVLFRAAITLEDTLRDEYMNEIRKGNGF